MDKEEAMNKLIIFQFYQTDPEMIEALQVAIESLKEGSLVDRIRSLVREEIEDSKEKPL